MERLEIRNIEIISYDLDELFEIINKCDRRGDVYYYIYHDKDITDTGELKKPHYHVQLYSDEEKRISTWASIYNVTDNRIEKIKNKISAIRYLTHCDNNEKYQYQIENIGTNGDLMKYFKSTISSEGNEIELIYEYITNLKRQISYKEMWDYVIGNGIWSTYRRNYSIIKDLLYDHNLLFTKSHR